jgi:hypothetical protein
MLADIRDLELFPEQLTGLNKGEYRTVRQEN